MGFFSGLDAEPYDRQYSDRQLLGRMAQFFKPHARAMLGIGLLALLHSLLGAAVPVILSRALDALGARLEISQIFLVTAAVFASGFLTWAANWWQRRITARTVGDVIMAIVARHLKSQGALKKNLVVATVMSNLGFRKSMAEADIDLIETKVGDRYVMEALIEHKASLGGEQSGHVIFRDLASTGDGLLTAIQLVAALRAAAGPTLGELAARIPRLPQVVINSAVRHKDQWQVDPLFADAVARATARLGSRGRILIRSSGTEPKLRIMVEGENEAQVAALADSLGALAAERLN